MDEIEDSIDDENRLAPEFCKEAGEYQRSLEDSIDDENRLAPQKNYEKTTFIRLKIPLMMKIV